MYPLHFIWSLHLSFPSPLSMSFPSQDAHSSASNNVPFPSSATQPDSPKTAALMFIHDTMTVAQGGKDSGSGQCCNILATCTIVLIYRA